MSFNKGDFTQQGVDGHVRATLRLNEKRYVELDLTTNENARGCTISGNVHDRLNNLDYPIGAAPSGNIEITENTAEPLNIAQYATATVNVAGGGSLPVGKCTITIVNSAESTMNIDFGDSAIPLFRGGGLTVYNNAFMATSDYFSDSLGEDHPVITPGQSLETDSYYDANNTLAVGYTTANGYSIQVSNIVNMEISPAEDEVDYIVTDTTLDSAITLTVVHTI